MRRRSVLVALVAAAASSLAGCSSEDGTSGVAETATAAPVPTDPPTPEAGSPADLSALGVADAAALGDEHWRTLSAGPHRFSRVAVVSEGGEPIRRMRVAIRATARATAYHFTFEAEDTERYPSQPAEPYVELWDDGTTFQRYGREEPTFAVSEGRSFDAPSQGTTERFRVRRVFEAFSAATVESTDAGFEVVETELRPGYDVTPRRLRLLEPPRSGRLAAVVQDTPTYVDRYDLTLRTRVSDRAVGVEERVDYGRLDRPPEPPAWIERAREAAGET